MGKRKDLWLRFWDKVAIGDGCWEWQGSLNYKGYGRIQVSGEVIGSHRVAWKIERGEVPSGMHVCHHCDNPKCVRPGHLFIGTNYDNAMDREMKGRGRPRYGDENGARTRPDRLPRGDEHWSRRLPERRPRGTGHGMARLSESDVREIRRRCSTGEPFASVARVFGVSDVMVGLIHRRRKWSHVA